MSKIQWEYDLVERPFFEKLKNHGLVTGGGSSSGDVHGMRLVVWKGV